MWLFKHSFVTCLCLLYLQKFTYCVHCQHLSKQSNQHFYNWKTANTPIVQKLHRYTHSRRQLPHPLNAWPVSTGEKAKPVLLSSSRNSRFYHFLGTLITSLHVCYTMYSSSITDSATMQCLMAVNQQDYWLFVYGLMWSMDKFIGLRGANHPHC